MLLFLFLISVKTAPEGSIKCGQNLQLDCSWYDNCFFIEGTGDEIVVIPSELSNWALDRYNITNTGDKDITFRLNDTAYVENLFSMEFHSLGEGKIIFDPSEVVLPTEHVIFHIYDDPVRFDNFPNEGLDYSLHLYPTTSFPQTTSYPNIFTRLEIKTIGDETQGLSYPPIIDYAFSNWNILQDVRMSISSSSFPQYAFANCTSLRYFEVPSSLQMIGDHCFENCISFDSFNLRGDFQLSSFGNYSFYNCTALDRIDRARSCEITFGDYAFAYCISLDRILEEDSKFIIGENCFFGISIYSLDYCTSFQVANNDLGIILTEELGYFDLHVDGDLTQPFTLKLPPVTDLSIYIEEPVSVICENAFAQFTTFTICYMDIESTQLTSLPTLFGKCNKMTELTILSLTTIKFQSPLFVECLCLQTINCYDVFIPLDALPDATPSSIGIFMSGLYSKVFDGQIKIWPSVTHLLLHGMLDLIKSNAFDNHPNITFLSIIEISSDHFAFENNIIPSQIKSFEYSYANIDYFYSFQSDAIEEIFLAGEYSITQDAFKNFKNLKSLHLDSVTVPVNASDGLTKLTTLSLNTMVTASEGVFSNIKLENLTLNIDDLEYDIGDYINSFSFNLENLKTLRIATSIRAPFKVPLSANLNQLTTFGFSASRKLTVSSASQRSVQSDDDYALDLSVLGNPKIENIEIFSRIQTSCNQDLNSLFPGLKSVTIGEGMETLGSDLLTGLNSITLNLPSTMTEVDVSQLKAVPNLYVSAPAASPNYCFQDGVFYGPGYSSITGMVPQSEVVTIHEGPTTIPGDLFAGNSVVKGITIPSTVNYIESGAFSGCSNLENMRCESTKVDFGENVFDEGKEITVSVPEDYQGDSFGGSNIVKEDNPSGGNEESPDPSKGNDPLDGGAIAGIVIAVVVVIAAICIGVFLYLKKKNTSSASSGSSSSSGEAKV